MRRIPLLSTASLAALRLAAAPALAQGGGVAGGGGSGA